jgi:hypothetical protein
MSHQKISKRLSTKNVRYDVTLEFIEARINLAIVKLLGTFAN